CVRAGDSTDSRGSHTSTDRESRRPTESRSDDEPPNRLSGSRRAGPLQSANEAFRAGSTSDRTRSQAASSSLPTADAHSAAQFAKPLRRQSSSTAAAAPPLSVFST